MPRYILDFQFTCHSAREVRRLRLNIFMVLVLSFLGGLGYSSTLSSMHAFITNPSTHAINSTDWVCVIFIVMFPLLQAIKNWR